MLVQNKLQHLEQNYSIWILGRYIENYPFVCSIPNSYRYLPANVEAVYVADLLLKEVFDEDSESIELSTEVIAICERHEVLLTTGKLCDHACSRLLLLRRLMKKSKNINKWKLLQKIVCLADLWCWQVTNVTHFDISTYKLKSLLQLLIIKQLFYIFWKIKLKFDKNFVKATVLLNS